MGHTLELQLRSSQHSCSINHRMAPSRQACLETSNNAKDEKSRDDFKNGLAENTVISK